MYGLIWLLLLQCFCFTTVQSRSELSPRKIRMRCRGDRARVIQRELEWATMMIANARQALSINDPYYRAFFRSGISEDHVRDVYQNLSPLEALSRPSTGDRLTVTCNQDAKCRQRPRSGSMTKKAWTNDGRQIINFCDSFFEEGHYSRLLNRQIDGPTDGIQCDSSNRASLWEYRSRGSEWRP